jgi:hypothetical protein
LPDHKAARFRGSIAGVGSSSGVRVVVGSWAESPFGAFDDVMLARADGIRHLFAPTPEIASFVSATYTFDEVSVVPVVVRRDGASVHVDAGELDLSYEVGGRTALGRVLQLVPPRVAVSVRWSWVTDRVARVAMPGVRTRGSAGGGRREVYGATDHHVVTGLSGTWRGESLGTLAPVSPDPGFGFGSTPERPSVTHLVTTVLGSSLTL